jgi:hypothetical protein
MWTHPLFVVLVLYFIHLKMENHDSRPTVRLEFVDGTWITDYPNSTVTFDGIIAISITTGEYPNIITRTRHRPVTLSFYLPLADMWTASVYASTEPYPETIRTPNP